MHLRSCRNNRRLDTGVKFPKSFQSPDYFSYANVEFEGFLDIEVWSL